MAEDPEIKAIAAIAEILGGLEAGAAERVLKWAKERFGVSDVVRQIPGRPAGETAASLSTQSDLAGLFEAAEPATEPEKVLVAGFWRQQLLGESDLDAQLINSELRHLGHGISNITRAFDQLINQRPQLAIQTRKSGSAKQARKKYRITAEGMRAVQRMINRDAGSGD